MVRLQCNPSGLWGVGGFTCFTRMNDDHHSTTTSTCTRQSSLLTGGQRLQGSKARSVRRFFDDVGGEGMVAGNTDGVAGQGVQLPSGRVAAGQEEVAQCGEEDLAVRR